MVVGDQKKFVSALIVPSPETLKVWCEEHGVAWTNINDIVHNETVISRYQHAIDKVNVNFSHIEQIKKFVIIPTTWEATRNDGTEAELTPTMKLKRRVILTKFAEEIDKLYA
jgi:long-chain acyl-CoA synthetase